jgi:hypothetical protein
MESANYSDPAVAAFVVLPVLLLFALIGGTSVAWRRSGSTSSTRATSIVAVAAIGWMALTWVLAGSGVLREWTRVPPPFGLLLLAIVALSAAIAFTPLGRRLALFVPLWALVGVQAFRLPLELAMHRMYERGIMPAQMTYTGRNFDIVTGITAAIVAALLASGYAGRKLAAAWNVMGLALVLNVVIIAVLSTPTFALFGPERLNVFVTYTPFIWLPAVMVLAAFAGHLIVFRALLSRVAV